MACTFAYSYNVLIFIALNYVFYQFSSVTQLCLTLSDPMDCSTPGIPVHHWSLLKLMSIASVMPSNLCCPLLFPPSIFPSIRGFSNELVLCIRWSKYWNFSFSISSSNEYSALIFFRMDWFDLLAVQGLSRVFSNTTVQKHQFFHTMYFYTVDGLLGFFPFGAITSSAAMNILTCFLW